MRIQDLRITIVGGAIGGSAAALLLARAGARVTLFERVERPGAVGAGIAIAANGFAVLESMGLAPALATAVPVPQPRVVDGRGRTLLATNHETQVRMLRRSTLQRVMLDAIAAEPRITTHFGAEVQSADANGNVTVRHTDGTERRYSSDLVIAADGVHSMTRAQMNVNARVRKTGITYLRTLVDAPAQNVEAWTAAGLFGSFAVDGGTYVFASAAAPRTRAAIAARDLTALRAVWRGAYPASSPLLDAVASFDQLILNDVTTVECARWSDGCVVLLGDAAHAMAPNLGQGANSALVDAAVLLDAIRHEPHIAAALAAYERRRRKAVTYVARTAARLGAIAEQTRAVPRIIRDRMVLPILQRVAGDPTPRVLQEAPATLLAIGRATT